MKSYKFNLNEKEYELGENNCDYYVNDEEKPVMGIEREDILGFLSQSEGVEFGLEYYDQPCHNCLYGKEEKTKAFKFLEGHFYIFTKNNEYVISSISKEYKDTSFNKLLKKGKVDNSYIVSIMVCSNCGNYSIEIEQCEV
jgi:hypothetical protein